MIVIDASVALAWTLQEPENAEAFAALEYIADRGAYVPGNFHADVIHGLLQAQKHKRLTDADVAEAISNITALSLVVEPPDPHVVAATARTHGLTGYDASYLALALRIHLPLATVDAHLAAAAKSAKSLWKAKG
ncbi:MAG: type II toxin-antitoxin system VapC family toxin [Candidatus Tyrphobacter sp.]